MIETIFTVIIIYILYFIFSVSKFDKYNELKKNKKKDAKEKISLYNALPAEVKYFVKRYNVDLNKFNVRGLLKLIGLVLGVDIGIVLAIVLLLVKKMAYQIILGFILLIPIYLISLRILARYLKKKGLI